MTSKSSTLFGIGAALHNYNTTNVTNTVTFTSQISGTITASYTGYVEGGFNGALFTAKAQVSPSIQGSLTYSAGISTTYAVAPHRTGYAQMTTLKWKSNIRTWKYNLNCVSSTIGTGTFDAPTTIGWKTWTV